MKLWRTKYEYFFIFEEKSRSQQSSQSIRVLHKHETFFSLAVIRSRTYTVKAINALKMEKKEIQIERVEIQ